MLQQQRTREREREKGRRQQFCHCGPPEKQQQQQSRRHCGWTWFGRLVCVVLITAGEWKTHNAEIHNYTHWSEQNDENDNSTEHKFLFNCRQWEKKEEKFSVRNGRLSFANLSLKATANCSQERAWQRTWCCCFVGCWNRTSCECVKRRVKNYKVNCRN